MTKDPSGNKSSFVCALKRLTMLSCTALVFSDIAGKTSCVRYSSLASNCCSESNCDSVSEKSLSPLKGHPKNKEKGLDPCRAMTLWFCTPLLWCHRILGNKTVCSVRWYANLNGRHRTTEKESQMFVYCVTQPK